MTAAWAARAQGRLGGAQRRGLRPGRPRHALSRQLRAALLGLEPGQDARRGRRTSSIAGRAAGVARGVPPALCGARSRCRACCARPRSASSTSCPRRCCRGTAAAAIEALDEIEGVKVAETGKAASASRSSSTSRRAKRSRRSCVTPYVERVAASDNLRRALDGSGPDGAEAKPFGPPAEAAGQARRHRPTERRTPGAARARAATISSVQ